MNSSVLEDVQRVRKKIDEAGGVLTPELEHEAALVITRLDTIVETMQEDFDRMRRTLSGISKDINDYLVMRAIFYRGNKK